MSDSEEPVSKRLRQRKEVVKPKSAIEEFLSKLNPAPENAPSNSLLHLDDKCLAKLFEYFDADTLCTMANTCKRFRATAEKVFSEQYKNFKCPRRYDTSKVRRVIRKFGSFINSFVSDDLHGLEPSIIAALVKYCRPNLRKLSLAQTEIDCKLIRPLFPQLKDLTLDTCDFVGNPKSLFEICWNLEYLYFDPGAEGDDINFLVQKYPKLKGLAIDCNPPMDDIIYPMLESNPQLKNLTLMAIADDDLISNVVECTKNLEQLTIRPGGMFKEPEEQTKRGLTQLAKLRKLTHLTLDASYEAYAELIGPLADAMSKAKARAPFEKLDLSGVYIDSKDIPSICKLVTLKRLLLNDMRNVTDTDLISLTASLPLLAELQLYFGYGIDKAITVDTLVQMIENAKDLEFLALIGIRNLRINQTAFEKMLDTVPVERKKLTIHVIGCKTTTNVNVPENIRNSNEKRLVIVHTEDDDNRCPCQRCEEEYINSFKEGEK